MTETHDLSSAPNCHQSPHGYRRDRSAPSQTDSAESLVTGRDRLVLNRRLSAPPESGPRKSGALLSRAALGIQSMAHSHSLQHKRLKDAVTKFCWGCRRGCDTSLEAIAFPPPKGLRQSRLIGFEGKRPERLKAAFVWSQRGPFSITKDLSRTTPTAK